MDAERLLEQVREAQAGLEAQAARIEATYAVQEARLAELEKAAGQRIRGLEATVADLTGTLSLAGETMTAVMDVCRRHGYEAESGLSALEWLEHVLDWAAGGWPSAN